MNIKQRILVVEDRVDIIEARLRNISRLGYEVDAATTKEEALEKVRRKTYHVAMIDVNLTDYAGDGSDRSGIEIVEKIKSLNEGTACIVISAEKGADVPVDAHEIGIAKYIIKDRIRTPDDYLQPTKDIASKVKLNLTGSLDHLNAYLARPLARDDWELQLIGILKCDSAGLDRILNEAVKPYLPVLRPKNAAYSFHMDRDRKQVSAQFWSKALGTAIWIAIGQKGVELDRPLVQEGREIGEIVDSRTKGAANFTVWRMPFKSRDDYQELALDQV